MSEKLKPCPECKEDRGRQDDCLGLYIKCGNCNYRSHISEWRYDVNKLLAEIDRLKEYEKLVRHCIRDCDIDKGEDEIKMIVSVNEKFEELGDRLKFLEQENKKLKSALKEISQISGKYEGGDLEDISSISYEALK